MTNVLSNLTFGKVAPGYVRLGLNGQMAIKVGNDYKYYDPKDKRLYNCDNFVFDIGSEFFFVFPTNKVEKGDIVLIGGKPVYVLEPEKDGRIEVLSYDDSSIKTVLPERHTFLGGTYLYQKIVSLFGNKQFDSNTLMKFMMMNTMFGGGKSGSGLFGGAGMGEMNPMMLMMFMGGNNPFNSLFDFSGMADGLFDNILGNTAEKEEKAE